MRRRVYAMMLVAIYIVASALSSFSLLLCDDHHSHANHKHEHHDVTCVCHGMSYETDCCNHTHPVLGENHTDYIASSQRSDSRLSTDESNILAAYALLAAVVEVVTIPQSPTATIDHGDEVVPLSAAFIQREALRGPPALA